MDALSGARGAESALLYTSLAEWWPLLSAPEEYEEEAGIYAKFLLEAARGPVETLLELGSGGGNNASHLKRRFRMTLADVSPAMLGVSRRLNPECEHVEGDMRTLRLGREFDCVFIQDAICHMETLEDLRRAAATARVHCRSGGAALFAPDYVRETFRPGTAHGGHDGEGRSLRYLEWTWDPDPADSSYVADYAFMMRGADGAVRVAHDRYIEGLFSRGEWLEVLHDAGFEPRIVTARHSEIEEGPLEMFVGVRR
ncbi:MAG TPA: class I SAM-dependent methyltransferase [Bryobacteraceae bacterium]|nr:class I SAM-dependent methyltransferase [Bryobacterales bacterium]HRJ20562.1 class I SAM-dependent methyltransferase [Bryobacteraceae bacterium]